MTFFNRKLLVRKTSGQFYWIYLFMFPQLQKTNFFYFSKNNVQRFSYQENTLKCFQFFWRKLLHSAQIQKQGNILLPQECKQLIILTAVKTSNDGYFVEMPSKTYIILLVFPLYLRNLKFPKNFLKPLQKSLIQFTNIPGPNGSAEVCLSSNKNNHIFLPQIYFQNNPWWGNIWLTSIKF